LKTDLVVRLVRSSRFWCLGEVCDAVREIDPTFRHADLLTGVQRRNRLMERSIASYQRVMQDWTRFGRGTHER
jgi:hypothetical protein